MRSSVILCFGLLLFGFGPHNLFGQRKQGQAAIDSLMSELPNVPTDTGRVMLLSRISTSYFYISPAEGVKYGDQAVALARRIKWDKGLMRAYGAAYYNYLNTGNRAKALDYLNSGLEIAIRTKDLSGQSHFYNALGTVYNALEKQEMAIESYRRSVTASLAGGGFPVYAVFNIAMAYTDLKEYRKAREAFQEALQLAQRAKMPRVVANALINLASAHIKLKEYEEAMECNRQALELNKEVKNPWIEASAYVRYGRVYYDLKQVDRAISNYLGGLKIYKSNGNTKDEIVTLQILGETYLLMAKDTLPLPVGPNIPTSRPLVLQQAIHYYKEMERMSAQTKQADYRIKANAKLAEAYQLAGDYKAALEAYRWQVRYKDSLNSKENTTDLSGKLAELQFRRKQDSMRFQQELTSQQLREQALLARDRQQALELNEQKLTLSEKEKALAGLSNQKTEAELRAEQGQRKERERQLQVAEKEKALVAARMRLKQSELDAERQKRYYYLAGILALLGFSAFAVQSYRRQRKSNGLLSLEQKRLSQEKQKSDALLLNILPEEVAQELKEKGRTEPRQFEEVTVLFTDFVNFTGMAETLSPQQLVGELHECFKAFDEIIERHGLEKIKTIGDAYLAVSGLPVSGPDHAEKAVRAALDIRDFMLTRNRQAGEKTFLVRIGLHSGPVVAGIVGVKKFAYDIWGDTVNTAARMEQSSEPGRVNVSEATYKLVKDRFAFESRGQVKAKNKGELQMYFVEKAGAEVEA